MKLLQICACFYAYTEWKIAFFSVTHIYAHIDRFFDYKIIKCILVYVYIFNDSSEAAVDVAATNITTRELESAAQSSRSYHRYATLRYGSSRVFMHIRESHYIQNDDTHCRLHGTFMAIIALLLTILYTIHHHRIFYTRMDFHQLRGIYKIAIEEYIIDKRFAYGYYLSFKIYIHLKNTRITNKWGVNQKSYGPHWLSLCHEINCVLMNLIKGLGWSVSI